MPFRLLVNILAAVLIIAGWLLPVNQPRAAEKEDSAASSLRSTELLRTFKQHVQAGQSYFQAEDWPSAIREYLAAYQLHPQSNLLFNVAQSYRKANQPAKALQYYEEFLRIDPNSPLVPECEAQARAMRAEVEAEQVAAARLQAERLAQQRAAEASRLAQEKSLLLQKVADEQRKTDAIKKQPVYKKKWFWIVLGGAVLTASAVGIIVWQTLPKSEPFDDGAYTFTFPN